jgi:ribokinase
MKPGKPTILVVGSANMDLVVSCDRFPQPGETLFAHTFATYPGGKGANQAVAGARLGGRVLFLGKMGRDAFQKELERSLVQNGVCLDYLLTDPEAPTGVALITVDGQGQNEILVASGSNMKLTPAELEANRSLFAEASVVLLQLEVPVETVARAIELARQEGATVVLNPAPAQPLPASLLAGVDLLTPNETEAAVLTGLDVQDEASAEAAARHLLDLGVGTVIITLGARGALLVTPERAQRFPALRVQAVDTTAAGDAFNGALALALAQDAPWEAAVPFANAVAAFAVTRRGAQPSMPTLDELAGSSLPTASTTPTAERA